MVTKLSKVLLRVVKNQITFLHETVAQVALSKGKKGKTLGPPHSPEWQGGSPPFGAGPLNGGGPPPPFAAGPLNGGGDPPRIRGRTPEWGGPPPLFGAGALGGTPPIQGRTPEWGGGPPPIRGRGPELGGGGFKGGGAPGKEQSKRKGWES